MQQTRRCEDRVQGTAALRVFPGLVPFECLGGRELRPSRVALPCVRAPCGLRAPGLLRAAEGRLERAAGVIYLRF